MKKSLSSKSNNWKRLAWILSKYDHLNSNQLAAINNSMFRNNQMSVNAMVQIMTSSRGFVQIEKIRIGNNITRTWRYEGDKIIISNKTRLSWEKRLSQNNFIIL